MSKKTFNINNLLYPEEVIRQALTDFEGYALEYHDGGITIDDEDPQWVFDELINYTISLMNESI